MYGALSPEKRLAGLLFRLQRHAVPAPRVLAMGETLDMEVALWGLGDTTEDRRPVKQFFHVKMKVDKGKPKATVEPPESAGK